MAGRGKAWHGKVSGEAVVDLSDRFPAVTLCSMSGYSLRTNFPRLIRRTREAARLGINETLAIAVQIAVPLTPFLWGFLRRSIRFQPAQVQGDRIVGKWGSFDIIYALRQELFHKTKKHYLKKAADKAYPTLTARIRRQWQRMA